MALPLAPLFCRLSDVDILRLSALFLLDSSCVPVDIRPSAPTAVRTTQKGDDDV